MSQRAAHRRRRSTTPPGNVSLSKMEGRSMRMQPPPRQGLRRVPTPNGGGGVGGRAEEGLGRVDLEGGRGNGHRESVQEIEQEKRQEG